MTDYDISISFYPDVLKIIEMKKKEDTDVVFNKRCFQFDSELCNTVEWESLVWLCIYQVYFNICDL